MITIRRGTCEDTQRVLTFLAQVKAEMTHKEWLCLDTPEKFRERMENGAAWLWVAEDGEKLAGIFTVVFPGTSPVNYGWHLKLPPEDLARVVNMDTAAVHSDYRGRGLQRRLMQAAERELEPGKILLCTIHPDNAYSLRNAQSQGYEIQATLPMYGSVRHLLRKDSK
ncbi:MAG TPA: hypothetical protein DCO69_06405 [Clostridiales bacterium]|nr:hypothetical protein [Clostridiales bacterium]